METSKTQNTFRIILGTAMLFAGIGHLSFARATFQVQVPNWVPMDKDLVVVLSGYVEIVLALLLLFWKSRRLEVGIFLGIFYILIFPGNLAQYLNARDGFGLDTDTSRLIRLFFQPVLIFWAL